VRQRPVVFLLFALGLLPGPAAAAARARVGGTLSVGLLGVAPPGAEVGAETPEAASARALLALPLCRLLPEATAVLAALARVGASLDEVQVTALPGARFADGTPLRPGDVAETLLRAFQAHGPAASLLSPLATPEASLEEAAQHPEAPLRLRLAYAWPDFEASLCHPAFTPSRVADGGPGVGVGLYAQGPDGRLLAGRGVPAGAPFPEALAFASVSARGAARALQRGEVQAVLGASREEEAGALLFATYLVYRPGSLPEGALGVLLRVDLQALVRTFVSGPAVAMPGLLPPGLLGTGAGAVPPRGTEGGAKGTGRSFSLGYEAALPEHRAVAERLQVLLHDAGYAVRLVPETKGGLLRARVAQDFEAQLVSVLLPPLPAPALAVVLGLTGDAGLLRRELPPLGALPEASARAARVRARARELQASLPLVPLFARGLRVQLGEGLLGARRDGFGLLVLDDAFLVR
jgi:peptide/nickel transport system substrate-binding protein